jgi:hypothetical protein
MKIKKSIFISYSHKDNEFVTKLRQSLIGIGNFIWKDDCEITVGDDYYKAIGDAIQNTNFFCIVLSNNSVKSKFVLTELRQALTLQKKEKKILPLKVDNCQIPAFLRGIHYANFIDSYEKGISDLLKVLNPKQKVGEESLNQQLSTYYLKESKISFEEDNLIQYQNHLNVSLKYFEDSIEANFKMGKHIFCCGDIISSEKYFLKTISNNKPINDQFLAIPYLADIERVKGIFNAIEYLESFLNQGISNLDCSFKLGELYHYLARTSFPNGRNNYIQTFKEYQKLYDTFYNKAQKYLRASLHESTDSHIRLKILSKIEDILIQYLPNAPEFSYAYTNEIISEIERMGWDSQQNYLHILRKSYLDMAYFFASKYKIEFSKNFFARFLSKFENEKNEKIINDFKIYLLEIEAEKKDKFNQAEVVSFQLMTYEAVKANIYNKSIESHPSFFDQTSILKNTDGSYINFPKIFN